MISDTLQRFKSRLTPGLAIELTVNFLLPWLAYRLAQPHWGEMGGVIASAAPPLLWSIVEFARVRRVDALSLLVLAGIVLSLLATLAGGSARLLLVRESLISGLVGVLFLGSLASRRPIMFYLARATLARHSAEALSRFDDLWERQPVLAISMRTMTLGWGAGLTFEAALRAWLAWHWPIERSLALGPVCSYAIFGVLAVWTLWYRKRLAGRAAAATAAAAAAAR